MNFRTTPGILGLAALALVAAPPAAAQDSGWYAGANVGQSRSKLNDRDLTNRLVAPGFSTGITREDDHDTGFKVFAGYDFSRYFALEGGYFNLGHLSYSATTLPWGPMDGRLKVEGLNLDGVLKLPITERFSAFARYGVTYSEAKDTFDGTGPILPFHAAPSNNAWSYKFGGGLQYDFTRVVGMRAEWERYRIQEPMGNKGDIDLISAGVVFRFGRSRHGEAAPVTYVAAVAPPPEPVAAPVEPKSQIYCSTLDIQFNVDNDEIQDQDKERLAVVGTFMQKYPDTTARIEGHSDNVGQPEHNLALSRARADSVVTYLETHAQIAPSRLSAVGYGDARPVADNATEEGKRKNRRIDAVIACATDIEGLTVAPARVTMALVIDFDEDKADVKPEFDGQLHKVAAFLKANPTVTATVEGHAGNLKLTRDKAMDMSQKRAQNVVEYLVGPCGIDRARLTAQGYGSTRRFAYNADADGQQENRRVNIIFDYANR